jgi:hypothetical protein
MAATRKRPSAKAKHAAKVMCAPPPEMVALSAMVLRMSESIVRLESTVSTLVNALCSESRQNTALSRLHNKSPTTEGSDGDG